MPGAPRLIALREAGSCVGCGAGVPAGARAVVDRETATITCQACVAAAQAAAPPSGLPMHHGEKVVADRLDELTPEGVRLLHDRRIPRTEASIDHIAVAPAGVLVIDAKNHRGRVRLQAGDGREQPRSHRLMVGRRDGSHMVQGMHAQLKEVRDCLASAEGAAVPVTGVLCLVEAEWPLIRRRPLVIDDVHVVWPAKLHDYALDPRSLEDADIDRWHGVLADGFAAS